MANGNPYPFSLGPFSTIPLSPGRVYLDHNATTPPAEFVGQKISEWLQSWGNPSSIHLSGRGPKTILRDSRRHLAQFIGCDPLEIAFTSGGSEANNLALLGFWLHHRKNPLKLRERPEVLMSAVEHPSVLKCADLLRSLGAQVSFIPVLRTGHLNLDDFEKQLSPQTALVSVMAANNETGNLMPIDRVVQMAHRAGAIVHTDAVQALGKIPVRVRDWAVDMASFSAHKYYALKGAGALYIRRGVVIESLIRGGGQERGRRAGTENLLALASFGEVLRQTQDLQWGWSRLKEQRDRVERAILERIPAVKITGLEAPRLPNTSSLVVDGVDGETLLMNLDMKGYSVSTGAACSSGNPEPSPVLLAMGLSRSEAQSSLRLSLGFDNSPEDLDRFVETLSEVVRRLRSFRHGEKAILSRD